jgi:hypothetical protein
MPQSDRSLSADAYLRLYALQIMPSCVENEQLLRRFIIVIRDFPRACIVLKAVYGRSLACEKVLFFLRYSPTHRKMYNLLGMTLSHLLIGWLTTH